MVFVFLAACGEPKVDALLSSARDYIAKGDFNSAAIQLKNAADKASNDGEIRYLLADTLLKAQNPEGAVREYQRALELGIAPERIYPPLARALLEASSPEKVITELVGKSVANPSAMADLQTSIGQAFLTTGKKREARAAFQRALTLSPGYPGAVIGEARLLAGEGKLKEADGIASEVLAREPENPEALYLQAQVMRDLGRTQDAIAALEKVIKVRPRTVTARRDLASLLIQGGQYDQAAVVVEDAKKIAPKDSQLAFLDAQIALQRGNLGEARTLVHQVIRANPDNVAALALAGRIELQSGSYNFGEQFLRKALAAEPQNRSVRHLLVSLYLQAGEPARALEAIQPLLGSSETDPLTLLLAGETYLASRDFKTASQYLQRVGSLDGQGAATRTRLAQMKFAVGDADRALKDLQAISKSEPDYFQADIALVTSFMQRGDLDAALEASKTLEGKQPSNPITYQLQGAIYLAKHDIANARASFEKSLAQQPSYLPALQALARLDLQDARAADAARRYDRAVTNDPENAAVLLSYAALLRAISADTSKELPLLERALKAAPGVAEPHVAIIDFYLRRPDPKKALDLAQQAIVAFPDNPSIVEALGQTQLATGGVDQAIQTFGQLARLSPFSVSAQIQLAGAYAAANDYPRALQTLRGAQKGDQSRADLSAAVVSVLVKAERFEEAIAEARALQKRRPQDAAGYVLEADVRVAQKRWLDAAVQFRTALARSKDQRVANSLVASLKQLDAGGGSAVGLIGRWLKEDPKDFASHVYLADQAMARKDYKAAVPHLRILVQAQPNSAVLLNNLAWAGSATGEVDALQYAERAQRLAPGNPMIMDTLGWLLVERGEVKRGSEILQQAVALAPNSQEIRLHSARALLKGGRKEEARRELEVVIKSNASTPFGEEAATLLKSL